MSQGPEHWLLFEKPNVDYDTTEEWQSTLVSWVGDPTTATSEVREKPASPQEILLTPYFTGPGMIEEQDDTALLNEYLLSLKLDDIPDVDGNKSSQISDTGHFSSQESLGIKLADATDLIVLSVDGDEHSQPGDALHIPASASAFLPTSCNINDPSSQSPVGSSASWPSVIKVGHVEDHLKAVRSTQIQHAAGKRGKKDGIHRQAGCLATFTANLRSACNETLQILQNIADHLNSHWGLRPYKCGKCSYATASPATTKRHQLTCKGTMSKDDPPESVKQHQSATTSGPFPVSPVEPYAVGQIVVPLEAAEEKSAVGSHQIQQAAGKRRKKDGIYECQFRNAGCPATFTARHNLRYHHNSHWGLKPYKCERGECPYAAASPATTKRHQLTCKGTMSKDDPPESVKQHQSATTSGPFPVSPVEPYAVGQIVVPLEAAEETSVVGSHQIQQAAGKRRKKDGIYECQFRNAGCPATFTARHNLRYHHNSHWGLKPYKCERGECPYAAASPATTKRHRLTCKGTDREQRVIP